ncbi:AAA family ATPase [Bradyrhizobium arachidis]|uniref:AAA family ATPase n=1 Tax=Bradyrhizobium arachidis TaxID=858423 RepID=UPI0021612BF0|nr:adenylate/guanylate cyclase domain-containing protein [Bradyrhizobium arachidis]UVO26987.1 AAA family ATPase [Bradyrhizobium arachidis]
MDIAAWLRGLGLGQYERAFRENDVDAEVLADLTAEDLIGLGVSSIGHRRKLLAAIALLRAGSVPATPPPTTAPVAVPGTVLPLSEAERRQVTVMFADLVGSTALSARLDPEDLREVIGAYHRCVAETVARFDGFVAKYMGDGALLYFGYPQAHEDDAERAVRAGLALIDAVDQLQTFESLRVRIGIDTGLVVVGDLVGSGEAQERGVVGETPNLAARLQALGEPNTVVIGPTTRHLLGNLFEYRDLGTVAVKGFPQPVQVYQVLRSSAVESRFEAFHSAGLTPLVGREEEIELLRRRWQRATSGEGQVVLLSAEPGVGKSRLVAALQEKLQAEPYARLRCFCSPHHQGSALYPVIRRLERAAGFTRDDAPTVKLDKLEALLAGAATAAEDMPLLAELLSLPSDRYGPVSLSPQAKKERTLQALVGQIEDLSRRNPVLMVFEDAHWIDPTSLELLQLTVDRVQQLPVLLLLTFRPEFPPPWIGEPHVTMLALGRLNWRDTSALVQRVVGDRVLPSAIVHEIVDRTDGVPLFVEELTKAVLEAGAGEGDAKAVLSRTLPGPLAVPATLHASLLARLDRLGPEAKEIAQTGAAIGREFTDDLIRTVSPLPETPLQSALQQLATSQLIFRRGTSAYSFKHALVQDTAYGTLLRSKRQPLHARIARALEDKFPDIAATQPEVLAHHFTEADLAEHAVAYWRKAGQRAAERSAHAEAIAHLRKGLMLVERVTDPAERARRELDLQLVLAPVLISTKSWSAPEVEQAYLRARDLCRQAGDMAQLFAVSWGLWLVYQQRCEFKTARDLLDELFSIARRSADPALLLQAHHAAWTTLLNLPELTACRAHLEAGVALYRPDAHRAHKFLYGSHDAAVCNRYTAAAVLWPLGFPEQALAMVREAVSMARELSHPFSFVLALVFAAMIYQHRREAEPAREHAEAAIAMCAEHRIAPHLAAAGSILRGWAIAERGQAAEGIAEIRGGLAAVQPTGVRIRWPYYLALLAEASAWAGATEQGLTALAEAAAAVEETGERRWEAEICRLTGELTVARHGGDRAEAAECFRRAIKVAGRQGAKALELRSANSLSRLWRDQGKQQQAYDLLAPLYGWFTEGFDTPDLREAKALLDALR